MHPLLTDGCSQIAVEECKGAHHCDPRDVGVSEELKKVIGNGDFLRVNHVFLFEKDIFYGYSFFS